MSDDVEVPLTGGAQTEGLVRVAATIRRPVHEQTERVDALLQHLQDAGFEGAPRPLGRDAANRQVLSYIEGHVPRRPPFHLSDTQLVSAALLVRGFHDASATTPLRGDQEVVCHGDLGPHNTVFRGENAVAIIDWDSAAPGRRHDDVAHAVWCYADLIEEDVPVAEQARRAAIMCEAYGGIAPAGVVEELSARFRRNRQHHAVHGRPGAVQAFDRLIAWLHRHGGDIADGRP